MKTLRLFVVLAALVFGGVVAPSPARAREAISFDFFYDSLAPYGDWIKIGDYGPCWRPTNVDKDWTPYSDGYWAYTDAGWTWVSYEDFGGIVYHYGRWLRLEDEGWCWVPEYEWAPAWVSWRSSDDYVGWAPLPPEARWEPEVGISIWADQTYDIGPGYYSFCRSRDFGAPVLRGVIIDRGENITILRGTVNITNITYNRGYGGGRVIYNGGPNYERINRFSERRIPALKLVQNNSFDSEHWRDHRGQGGGNGLRSQTVGNQLIVTAPLMAAPKDRSAFKGQFKREVAGDKVSHGWNGVKDPEVKKELRQEISRQSKGLTPATAPARAVAVADLKDVPEKADPNAKVVTGEKSGKPGKGQRPDSVVVQPNNPPANDPKATPSTTSGTPEAVAKDKGRSKNQPATTDAAPKGNSNLKPFNPTTDTKQPDNAPAEKSTPRPRGPVAVEPSEKDRANAQRQAQMAEQQKENAAQQEAARVRAEDARRRQIIEQQKRPTQPESKPQTFVPQEKDQTPPQGKGQFPPQGKGQFQQPEKGQFPPQGKGQFQPQEKGQNPPKDKGQSEPKGQSQQFEKQPAQQNNAPKQGSNQKSKDSKGDSKGGSKDSGSDKDKEKN
ncbi:MAG: DUF6600 domain-containing protein [Chthoniobacter sp.]|uniref:DUF6600 domain-containing protein n=1 Tax=Chthoniobacter sp. TaxID=2510640 RepID=UPI0032AABA2D